MKRTPPVRNASRVLFSLCAITFFATSSYGQINRTWDGSTNTTWSESKNWAGTGAQADRVPDTIGEVAVFANATANDPASFGTAITIGGFSLTGGEARSLIFTNTIALDQYGVDNSSGLNLSITGAGTTTLTAAQTWSVISTGNTTFGKTIANGGLLLTLDGSNTGTGTVSGQISGGGGLTKNGTGIWTLTNQNTYAGVTTINGGTLFANNASGSATGTGAVSVTAGTLGGSGFIAPTGANGISVSGVLAPGAALNTIGTLTFNMGGTTGTVAMNSAASFEFQLGLPGGSIGSFGVSDLLSLASASAGDFAFNNNSVNFLNSGAVGFYKLFDTSLNDATTWTGLTFDPTSGLVNTGLTYTGLTSGLTGAFVMGTASNGGTTGDIYFQVVPEPGAALLGGLGTLLLLRRRRQA